MVMRTDTAVVNPRERARRIDEGIHSAAMEGLHPSTQWRKDAAEYSNGHIDTHELVARTRARYGLD
ncbi:hypothetical protein [Lysinibacter sp. HNR]|uniref:antitoxin VbhA family protein n=1 Tax=Lysinibacter sp. HNR TaxID=3031408 RepID=UPI002435E904|nr:hypothetical protein [Lysinibacter sp. HNR]WGD37565.1 hypothetical protein FrondiHNR_01175 [Lysinibacter sp. HNR]